MNEQDLQDLLAELLWEASDDSPNLDLTVRTFEEDGVMTMNKGLVLKLNSGSEFQLTIVQSR